ncbi:hypothetical protein BJ508DRAFT_314113 [Ascobolus immersus RN42]|uniref:Rhodopsin domain-containing protein n=1 Tax=Ascobolus immersus RN42 TaxID=1160509 RepID=A0A3N4HMN5_ASCIM|nr:hypothetical protein BJ508DRAFT_314113 [Ascobolus immersus RN42]
MAITPELQIGLQTTYFVITASLVALRYWALQLKKKRSGLSKAVLYSNVIILIVWVVSTAGEGIFIKRAIDQIQNRESDNPEQSVSSAFDVPLSTLESNLKQNLFIKIIYITLLWLCKSAFIAFYYDLHAYLSIPLRRALYATTFYTLLTYIASLAIILGWCRPFSTHWARGAQNCTPFHSETAVSLTSALNVSTDLLIMALPVCLLKRRKRLHTREKYSMLFIFSLGILTVSAAIARWSLILTFISKPENTLFAGVQIEAYELIAQLECLVAFIATCLPSLRVLLFRWWRCKTECGGSFGERLFLRSRSGKDDEESTAGGSGKSVGAEESEWAASLQVPSPAAAGPGSFKGRQMSIGGSPMLGYEWAEAGSPQSSHSGSKGSPLKGSCIGLGVLGATREESREERDRSLRREASQDLLNTSRELIEAHVPRRERGVGYHR